MIGVLQLVLLIAQALPQGSAGSVAGQLLTTTGTPAASVRVALIPVAEAANLSVLAAIAQTDSSGRYRIENIEPGTYYIVAGRVDQPTFYPGVATQTGARAVAVTSRDSITGMDFRVVTPLPAARPLAPAPPPTFSVTGNVVPDAGQQLPPDLRVSLSSGQSAVTRPDGSFEIGGVFPGTYLLRAGSLLSGKPVNVVVSDRNVSGISVSVAFMGKVTGAIESITGSISEPISLSFRHAADPFRRVAVSSSRPFVLDLPEGDYKVVPESVPDGYRIEALTAGSTNLKTDVLKIARGESVGVKVTLGVAPQPMPVSNTPALLRELSGRVLIEGGSSNAVAALRLRDESGARATAVFDLSLPNPGFKLAVPPGEYRVEVFFLAPGGGTNLRVKSVTSGSVDILAAPLRVTAEGEQHIQIVLGP